MRQWFVLTCLLAAGVLLGTPTAEAQYFGRNKVTYDDFEFKKLETEHFIFHFYPSEEQAVRDAARMAERWYDRHAQVFLHRFDEKKPIIFYANDADFQQTNVTSQPISPATGGFTEPLRERVVMPLSPSYGETDHVLGHELVHSFQYDLALNSDSLRIRLQRLPLWVIEGTAEYLSVGRQSPHTAMWMRDAVLRDDMPSFEALANPREYFPYRYGQAHMAYIGGKYGDQAVTNLYKLGGQIGLDSAYVQLFGISADSLTREWAAATKEAYQPAMQGRTHPDSAGQAVLTPKKDGGRVNIAPTLSPDGRYVAFISERSLFSFNLYVADAETGEVIAELESAGSTSHFNALRFINSAGTWSPDGRRLAFVSYADGDNQLTVWNVREEKIEQSFKVKGVTAMKNPAWSPDGEKIVFSGTDGGISDLYMLDLETNGVRQLTNDRYADLQPTWSPDGETIAFTTDRGDTDLNLLSPAKNMNLGLIDVESGDIEVREPFGDAHHHNPQFSPDGRSLYFVSDQDGFKDIYRTTLDDGSLFRVTHLKTGVSGITAMSPAMSIADESGDMMFSVYSDSEYTGFRLTDRDSIRGEPLGSRPTAGARPGLAQPSEEVGAVAARRDTTEEETAGEKAPGEEATGGGGARDTVSTADPAGLAATGTGGDPPQAGVLPPYGSSDESLVASLLEDPRTGLPSTPEYDVEDYDPSLSLEAIAPPRVGASVGGPFGSGVAGGVAFRFGDMLGNQTLTATLQARGTFRDIGGGVSYVNRGDQLNYGASASHIPIIYGARAYPVSQFSAVQVLRRIYLTQSGISATYPLSTTRRFEFGVGATRYGFGVQVRELGRLQGQDISVDEFNDFLGEATNGQLQIPGERDTRYLANATMAYVRDFTTSALTGPIRGGRWRVGVTPNVGSKNFVNVRADLRRYFYAKPFTFALQALHVGNYGAGSFDRQFGIGNEYIGYPYSQGFVRGYNVREIDTGRGGGTCTVVEGDVSRCAETERLFGTRAITTRAEVRVPFLGPDRIALVPFKYLPTTLSVFADAGITWDGDAPPIFNEFAQGPSAETTIPVTSAGAAARFNVLGRLILEMYYARPFQRTDTTWEWGLRISPGW